MRYLLAALFIVVGSTTFAAPLGIIRGTVVDSEGAVISKAYVIVHADASGSRRSDERTDATLRTDAAGVFRLEVEPGFYDVCVLADAFTPTCFKVFIAEGRTVERRTRLQIDSAVIERIGTRIPLR